MRRRLLLLLPLALSGCAGKSVGRWVAGNHPACENRGLEWAIGKQATHGTAKRMMRISRARDLRYIQPGRLATMDVRPDRLSVQVDASGRITVVRCG